MPDQETKRKSFRYNFALYFEQTSWLSDELGEYFEEEFEDFSLQEFKDIDSSQRRVGKSSDGIGLLMKLYGLSSALS